MTASRGVASTRHRSAPESERDDLAVPQEPGSVTRGSADLSNSGSLLRRFGRRLAMVYCLGDPNLGSRLRSLHVRKVVQATEGESIADIGCGVGGALGWAKGLPSNTFLLARYNPGSQVVGADADREIISRNRELLSRSRLKNLTFELIDLKDRSNHGRYQIVVLSDVVANRPGDADLIAGAVNCVKDGGRLILHTSARFESDNGRHSTAAPDGAGYDQQELSTVLSRVGAREVRLRYTFGPFGAAAWRLHKKLGKKSRLLMVLAFPISLFLGFFDLVLPVTRGHGILAIAEIGGPGGSA